MSNRFSGRGLPQTPTRSFGNNKNDKLLQQLRAVNWPVQCVGREAGLLKSMPPASLIDDIPLVPLDAGRLLKTGTSQRGAKLYRNPLDGV